MTDYWFIDLKKLVRDQLRKESQKYPLIAVYVEHQYAVVGELAQRLQIPLADVLLGHASIDKMDIVVLTFADCAEARAVFEQLPTCWRVEDEFILVQLWYQGELVAENI